MRTDPAQHDTWPDLNLISGGHLKSSEETFRWDTSGDWFDFVKDDDKVYDHFGPSDSMVETKPNESFYYGIT